MQRSALRPGELRLTEHGAEHCPGAASAALHALKSALADVPGDRAGVRLHDIPELSSLLAPAGAIGRSVAARLGERARAVRAILFDKTAETNWALGWHQDRAIAVRERREVPGFENWTVKRGMAHVAPPFESLAGMLTVRVHLDDVPLDNAPLLVAPGSHRSFVPEGGIDAAVRACGSTPCLAAAGDVWIYATPILHASERASGARRRVLQIDYATVELPGGLEWLGV